MNALVFAAMLVLTVVGGGALEAAVARRFVPAGAGTRDLLDLTGGAFKALYFFLIVTELYPGLAAGAVLHALILRRKGRDDAAYTLSFSLIFSAACGLLTRGIFLR
ncbi:MAG: hypothetical protein ACREJQ_06510 [bacterium]